MGERSGGRPNQLPGEGAAPSANERKVVASMPTRIAPGTLRADNRTIEKKQKIASSGAGCVRSPRETGAPGTPSRTIPVSLSPMKVRKRPIPTAKLSLRLSGSASASQLRILRTVRIVNRTPAMKTAPRAACQVYPIDLTTVNAMKAFSPMYGAIAKGRFA